jgi:hypothetical protein
MNETGKIIKLRDFMEFPEGWGRSQGRIVYQALIDFVEANPGILVFRVSLDEVTRVDYSFASETIVELARRYRANKGFVFIDLTDKDMMENWDAAAARKQQPIMVWDNDECKVIGATPTLGNNGAFEFALQRSSVRATEFAASIQGMTIANASMKFKQLWEQGFLLRREDMAGSGGIEYAYFRIK